MEHKIKILTLLVFLVIGGCAGYILFSIYPDYVLPDTGKEFTLIAMQANEIAITRMIFSILTAILFLSVAVSSMLTENVFMSRSFSMRTLLFFGAMIISVIFIVNYLQSGMTEKFSALGITPDTAVKLDEIPYFRVPALAAIITLASAVVIFVVSKIFSRN